MTGWRTNCLTLDELTGKVSFGPKRTLLRRGDSTLRNLPSRFRYPLQASTAPPKTHARILSTVQDFTINGSLE